MVDLAGVDRFDLFDISGLGTVAMQFAVDHPERVNRLVLWGAAARGEDLFQSTGLLQAIDTLTAIDNSFAIDL